MKPDYFDKPEATSRRKFLKNTGIAALSLAVGTEVVFTENYHAGMIPAILQKENQPLSLPGKHPDLVILNDNPINAETPAHLLDDKITSRELFFVRNNGDAPAVESIDLKKWTLSIGGEAVKSPKTYLLDDLKTKFQQHTYHLTLECVGNGRHEFNPPAHGGQWTVGAVGCAAWTGVRLKDVLLDAGLKSNAVYIGYYGKDSHISGKEKMIPISRGVPVSKALEDESLIAWKMNGEDIPLLNGYPLRLVFGGWPASCSGKWLYKIDIRNKVHDGPKMEGQSYRMPCEPVAPGTPVDDKNMCIIESMPVKSLITFPKTGATIRLDQQLPIRGHSWAGDLEVTQVFYSIDFGSTWQSCTLEKPVNRLAWQHFNAKISFPGRGYYEVWARAVDSSGKSQPMLLPGWNPNGYLNNACHRIAIKVV